MVDGAIGDDEVGILVVDEDIRPAGLESAGGESGTALFNLRPELTVSEGVLRADDGCLVGGVLRVKAYAFFLCHMPKPFR